MDKLYEKDELKFAIVMIVVYVVGNIIAENISSALGIEKLFAAIFNLILTTILLIWPGRKQLMRKYGLVMPTYPLSKAWYFLPLILVACFGLIGGFQLNFSPLETAFYIVSMICVGFLEELIFRGFLFKAMAKTNLTQAIHVSAITFGIGHIVNLFNGADFIGTIFQIIFAVAVGYTLVLLFYKGGSLLPCIAFHSLNNALSGIEKNNAQVAEMLSISEISLELMTISFFVVLLLVYIRFCLKKLDKFRVIAD